MHPHTPYTSDTMAKNYRIRKGKWTKYSFLILLLELLILMGCVGIASLAEPYIGRASMFIPIGAGVVLFVFLYINRDKFSRF